jgi:hypothetical protein
LKGMLFGRCRMSRTAQYQAVAIDPIKCESVQEPILRPDDSGDLKTHKNKLLDFSFCAIHFIQCESFASFRVSRDR